jgi:hypothetical protein
MYIGEYHRNLAAEARARRSRLWVVPAPPVPEPVADEAPSRPSRLMAEIIREVIDAAVLASPLTGPPVPVEKSDPEIKAPRVRFIIEHVAAFYGISMLEMISDRRETRIVKPRQVAMYLARRLTARSLPEIGRQLGGKDHTTVIHGSRKIAADLETSDALASDIAELTRRIEAGEPVVVKPPPVQPTKKRKLSPSLYVQASRQEPFWDERRTAEFIRLWHEGLSSADMGERYGRTASGITEKGRKMGLPARRGNWRPQERSQP